ncbi:MAG: hypothetical protein WCR51_04395 [Planctomycetia bacterium]
MGATTAKNRRRGSGLASKYRRWGRIVSAARASAEKAIHPEATPAEIEAAIAKCSRKLVSIPAPVLAMEAAMSDCERLVQILGRAGLRFASRKNAPAQLAAAAYAGWIACHSSRGTTPADWMGVVASLVDGVEHAIEHGTGTPRAVRQAVIRATARR